MPAHFTHIYTARRVAEYLSSGHLSDWTGPLDENTTPPLPVEGVGRYGARYCGDVMRWWEKHTALGAIGPDLFYFSQDYASHFLGQKAFPVPPSDDIMLALAVYYYYNSNVEQGWEPLLVILDKVNSTMGELVRFLIKLEKIWKEFLGVWASTVEPFVSAADSALDDLTGGVVSAFQDGIKQLKAAIIAIGEEEVTTFQDIFAAFDTCVAKAWDEQSFLWGDTTHYRRTTAMGRALVEEAERLREEDATSLGRPLGVLDTHPGEEPPPNVGRDPKLARYEQMLAFALGWMTHVGTDTVGHAFTNTQCGGPFRNHPQRHHLIENHMDAWVYQQSGTGKIPPDPWGCTDVYPYLTVSGLGFCVQWTPDRPRGLQRPDSLPADDTSARAALNTDGEMDLWMAEAIVRALKTTYLADSVWPGGPKPRTWTHPRVYKGSAYQSTITEGILTQAIEDVTGHGEDKPFPLLLADICPTPGVDVPDGFPLPWQVRTFYRFALTFYALGYRGNWDLSKPRRPDVVIVPPTSDVSDLLTPPDFSGPSSGDPIEDACNALKALFDWVKKELDAATKLAGDLIKMLASPGSYPIRLVLYELAMLVWDVVQRTHEILAHLGFFVPHGEAHYADGELRFGNEVDQSLVTLGQSVDSNFQQALQDAFDPFGNLDRNPDLAHAHDIPDPNYPYYQVVRFDESQNGAQEMAGTPSVETQEFRRPWAYPDRNPLYHNGSNPTLIPNTTELGRGLKSGPYPGGTRPDDVFFRLDPVAQPQVRALYEDAQDPRTTDDLNDAHLLHGDNPANPLGDPVVFSGYLIGRIANDRNYATQFNLDSDRAFGYLTWDWIRDDRARQQPHEDLGYAYPPPNTWPQLATDDREPMKRVWDPTQPVEIEYIDKPPIAPPPPQQPPK